MAKEEIVKTDLGTLIVAQAALGRLTSLKLPVKSAYHLAKLSRLVGQEVQLAEDQRVSLIKEIGVERDATDEEKAKGEVGPVHQVEDDKMPEFRNRLNELRAIEVSIPWGPVTPEMLGDTVVSGDDILALGPLFVDASDTVPVSASAPKKKARK